MCVLALWVGIDRATPLIVAANRDEVFGRPAAPPSEIEPGIVGGRDLQAGGTWLGVNRHALFVAMTNRRQPPRPVDAYSRGLLALDALRCGALRDVEDVVASRTHEHAIAGFNMVAVLGGEGLCLHWDGELRTSPLAPGLHVVSNNHDLDDDAMPEKKAVQAFADSLAGPPDASVLQELLRSHEGDRSLCKHDERYGTRSSAIYVAHPTAPRLLYADGAPCATRFVDCSALLPRR